jgi:phosphoribosylglycinamide formyltransferase 1
MTIPVAVLISGSGTNLQAILDACEQPSFGAHIAIVISNRKNAYGLQRAAEKGVQTKWVPHRSRSREEFEEELISVLKFHKVEWILLAGFMRVLTAKFLSAFHHRVLNIHPSLLPSFPGMNAQQQALDYGVKRTGATVHFVDAGMDTGPIILQDSVPVYDTDTIDTLKRRILSVEHVIFPKALHMAISNSLQIVNGIVRTSNK